MTRQINVFVENKPGRLLRITSILRDQHVNIRAVEIQDRGDFGVVKLLVNDPQKAHVALNDAGLAAAMREIVAVAIEDRPGALCELAECFDRNRINITDAYGFVLQASREAIWCVEVEDPAQVTRIVAENGFRVVDEDELYEF